MKVFDEDGKELEMPSQDELKGLQEKAEKAGKADELEGLVKSVRDTLGLGETEDVIDALKVMNEAANPQWKAARQKIDRLQTFIKSNFKGAAVDEDGNPVIEEKIDIHTVEERARGAARQEIYGQEINKHLQKYPKEEREVVKKYFDKLIAGEEVNSETIPQFIEQAESAAFPKKPGLRGVTLSGKEPQLEIKEGQDFSDTEQGKQIANEMFGEESFAKKGDK